MLLANVLCAARLAKWSDTNSRVCVSACHTHCGVVLRLVWREVQLKNRRNKVGCSSCQVKLREPRCCLCWCRMLQPASCNQSSYPNQQAALL
jgi:hypothetical protein